MRKGKGGTGERDEVIVDEGKEMVGVERGKRLRWRK